MSNDQEEPFAIPMTEDPQVPNSLVVSSSSNRTTTTATAERKKSTEEKERRREEAIDRLIARSTLFVGVILLIGGIIALVIAKVKGKSVQDGGTLVGILCLAGGFVMGSWGWLLKNSAKNVAQDVAAAEETANARALALEREEDLPPPPPSLPPRPLIRNRLGDVPKEGEPPFDRLIVGGTLSLGIIMLIGGLIILTISLVNLSSFKDASLDDFESLGPEGCRIQSVASYEVVTQKLDALNSLCNEVYQYQVEVMDQENTTFVSTVLSTTRCRVSCDRCPPSLLFGQGHYIGVDPLRLGEAITDDLFVECWAPTKPANELSDFYKCGVDGGGEVNPSATAENKCYQLIDTSEDLKEEQASNKASLIASIIGLAGAAIMTFWGSYFVWRNRTARKEYERGQTFLENQSQDSNSGGEQDEQEGDAEEGAEGEDQDQEVEGTGGPVDAEEEEV